VVPELKVVALEVQVNAEFDNFDLIGRFSSDIRFLRVTAYCLRFSKNSRGTQKGSQFGYLFASEFNSSLLSILKIVQNEVYHDELAQLKYKSNSIKRNIKLLGLQPILLDGIIRVRGRLDNSNLSEDQKHPMIISGKHLFTELLFRYEYKPNLHCAPQLLLSFINQRFWVIGGKSLAKRTFQKCIKCFRVHPRGMQQIIGDLPADRLTPSRAFYVSGVDLAGPISLTLKYKRGKIE
jgi:hypothetical protein